MVQELKSKVVIVGGGPAGCICAYFLQNDFEVTVIEKNSPLKTLLPTGGGRCNLCHAEFDFKELAEAKSFYILFFQNFLHLIRLNFLKKLELKLMYKKTCEFFRNLIAPKMLENTF